MDWGMMKKELSRILYQIRVKSIQTEEQMRSQLESAPIEHIGKPLKSQSEMVTKARE